MRAARRSSLKSKTLGSAGFAAVVALALAGCGAGTDGQALEPGNEEPGNSGNNSGTLEVTDNHGTIEVPLNPERVVALDNLTAQTLLDWDVDVVAAPKQLFRLWPEYSEDPDILDVGTHREPHLESIVAADADLIITGGRFGAHYDQLVDLNPAVVDLTVRDDEDHTAELIRQTEVLGQIFDRQDEAAALVADLENSIEAAQGAYDEDQNVLGLITSGGQILYAAPREGRSVGALFPTLGLQPAIEVEASDETHGDDISVELIADADPDWMIVLDRDALFDEDDYVSSRELIADSPALQHVTAVTQEQIIYLPGHFYMTEGIHAYTELYNDVADAFSTGN